MSRGLGSLQTEIIETLEEAKRDIPSYPGQGSSKSDPLPFSLPGWVIVGRTCALLAEDVYDLRASAAFLAKRRGLRFATSGFQASFSRAVRSLVSRGLLAPLSLVPVTQYEEEDRYRDASRIEHLKDGLYLTTSSRQIRFVRHHPSTTSGTSAPSAGRN